MTGRAATETAGGIMVCLHGTLPRSRANGPGPRSVVWFQGCTLGCPGCFNPGTHRREGGYSVPVEELAGQLSAGEPAITGVTVSGGEPFQQPRALLALVRKLRAGKDLSILSLLRLPLDRDRGHGTGAGDTRAH